MKPGRRTVREPSGGRDRAPTSPDALLREADAAAGALPPVLLAAERVALAVAAGLHGRRRAGPGETFWQHRAYASGDPTSLIDWRQSARVADRLYVRQNEWEAAAAMWIWRDGSRSLDYASSRELPTKRRRADILCVASAILFSRAGERVGLMGVDRRAYMGRTAPGRFAESLAAAEDAVEPPAASRLAPGASALFVSDFFLDPDRLAAAVLAAASAGARGALVQIVDPAEEEFPFAGRTEFEDPETRERLAFGDAAAVADAYRRRFAAHRERLQDLARRASWTLIAHRTDRPPQTALLAVVSALGA